MKRAQVLGTVVLVCCSLAACNQAKEDVQSEVKEGVARKQEGRMPPESDNSKEGTEIPQGKGVKWVALNSSDGDNCDSEMEILAELSPLLTFENGEAHCKAYGGALFEVDYEEAISNFGILINRANFASFLFNRIPGNPNLRDFGNSLFDFPVWLEKDSLILKGVQVKSPDSANAHVICYRTPTSQVKEQLNEESASEIEDEIESPDVEFANTYREAGCSTPLPVKNPSKRNADHK